MEIKEYRKHAADMIALTVCALNGTTPDAALTAQLNLPALFEICQQHLLTACVAYALESAGIRDAAFAEAKEKSVCKNILMDADRKKVLERLEAAGIWYMPLKGAVMKDWYPKLGMRQMSDNDILCDDTAGPRIREIMEDLGFTCVHYGTGHDDTYHKEPVSNFEMHRELFDIVLAEKLHHYYADVKEKLIRDSDSAYGYHFRDEDFYIYVLAHEYEHYMLGGTGVRSLIDIEIMQRRFGDSLDQDYVAREIEKLGISSFVQQSCTLSDKLFSGEPLTDAEEQALDYFITSGVYGTQEHRVENQLQEKDGSKLRYLFRRIFPSMNQIRTFDPFFYRHKWLIPVLWIWRPIRGLLHSREKLTKELKLLLRSGKQ